PIRVGDQVVVGDAEGIVKRINVRSTEIETFDRSAVIVPNSNLVSGVVRNRVRTDRTGRVLISIAVPRTLDPTAVRSMLHDAASGHGDVLQKPPPAVLFKKIGTATMDFDLICVVGDVDIVGRVTSDLNYAIHKRLAEMEPPAAAAEMTVKGLEGIEQSLSGIAQAVAQEIDARRQGAPSAKPQRPVTATRRARPAQPPEDEPEQAAPDRPAPAPAADTPRDENKE
ncbi:MAG: mechanosensitive ion channel family protein, partial [Bosea sp. (in: a-proteobacteria)]